MISIQAGENEAGVRLDRILRKRLSLMSLSAIYTLIRRNGVRVSGRKVRQDYRLQQGDTIEIDVDPSELAAPREASAHHQSLVHTDFFKRNFSILHEDSDLLACNKPAGLVVHPGTGHLRHDTLIDLAAAYLLEGKKVASPDDLALVHRLDRDTSGVILIAKSKPAVRRLHEAFRARSLVKEYVAVCHNRPPASEGDITLHLARHRDERGETTMRVEPWSAHTELSRSTYRLSAFHHGLSSVEVNLDTGKTHQIRIHLAHLGAPIVGDPRYGDATLDSSLFSRRSNLLRRLYLHAWKIEVPHPKGGRSITVKAPLPVEFRRIMEDERDIDD
jgi:23S rRNA pseudouridine955/2504/2580 synthase